MSRRWRGVLATAGLAAAAMAAWQTTQAQPPAANPRRFAFQVVECFDAKYLGDSPGHMGRGSLQGTRPDVALGDPVFHGEARIGKVSGLVWDRTKESLEVEFDPEPFEVDEQGRPVRANRVSVGQEVWLPLGGVVAPKAK